MADELKENVTTPWMQNELTAEEINRDDNAGENTGFWILRGKGSGRDRFINLKNLRVWIQAAVDAVAYIKDNGIDGIKKAFSFETGDKKTEVEAGAVTFSENGTSYGIFIEDDSIHFGGPSVFEDSVDFLGGIDSLTIHKDLTVNGNFNASDFKVNDVILMYKEVLATQKATFGTSSSAVVIEDGSVTVDHDIELSILRAKKYASARFGFINPIFLAKNKSELYDPSTLLSSVATDGLVALVKNGTGQDYVLSRQTGSDFMKIVVRPDEILQFVYDGSKWVHSW